MGAAKLATASESLAGAVTAAGGDVESAVVASGGLSCTRVRTPRVPSHAAKGLLAISTASSWRWRRPAPPRSAAPPSQSCRRATATRSPSARPQLAREPGRGVRRRGEARAADLRGVDRGTHRRSLRSARRAGPVVGPLRLRARRVLRLHRADVSSVAGRRRNLRGSPEAGATSRATAAPRGRAAIRGRVDVSPVPVRVRAATWRRPARSTTATAHRARRDFAARGRRARETRIFASGPPGGRATRAHATPIAIGASASGLWGSVPDRYRRDRRCRRHEESLFAFPSFASRTKPRRGRRPMM